MSKQPIPLNKLVKLLKNEKVSGYSVSDKKITIYVEDEATAMSLQTIRVEGYDVEVIVTGRFMAL